MHRNIQRIIVFILASFLSACSSNTVYMHYDELSDNGWSKDSSKIFETELTDSGYYYTAYLLLRTDGTYPYSNIYLKVTIDGPGGQKITETPNYVLARPDGKWLGKGFGDLRTFRFPLSVNMPVRKSGTYRFQVEQYMRTDVLNGVRDVGIAVEKGKEIF